MNHKVWVIKLINSYHLRWNHYRRHPQPQLLPKQLRIIPILPHHCLNYLTHHYYRRLESVRHGHLIALIYTSEKHVLKTSLKISLKLGLMGKEIFFDNRAGEAFEVFHLPLFAWNSKFSKFSKSSNSISPHKMNDINSLNETLIWLFDFELCRSLTIQYFKTKVNDHGPWLCPWVMDHDLWSMTCGSKWTVLK